MLPSLLLSLAPLGDLVVVGPSPDSGSPDSLQAAVDSAPPGSTLLIEPGVYVEDLLLGDKELALVALEGAELRGRLRIAELGFADNVLVDGLRVVGSSAGVEVVNCAGTVWLEDLDVDLKSVPDTVGTALWVDLCDNVLITGGRYSGRSGPGGFGVASARLVDAVVTAYACDLLSVAPDGKAGVAPTAGLEIVGSLAVVSASRVAGAAGTAVVEGPNGECAGGWPGGPGLIAAEGQFIPSEVTLISSLIAAGAAGVGTDDCPAPPAGKRLVISPSSTVDVLPTELGPRLHEATKLAVAGGDIALSFFGTPGEVVITILGLQPGPVFAPLFGGVFGTFDTAFVEVAGTLDDTGELVQRLQIQAPIGMPAARIYSQGLFFSEVDQFILASPRSTTVLAQAR